MAAAVVVNFGLADTADVYARHLRTPEWCKNLLSRNLVSHPYANNNSKLLTEALLMGRIRCAMKRWPVEDAAKIAMAEVLCPDMPDANFAPIDDAKNRYKKHLAFLLSSAALMNSNIVITGNNAADRIAAITSRVDASVAALITVLPITPDNRDDLAALDYDLFLPLWTNIANAIKPSVEEDATSILPMMHLALINQGNITARKLGVLVNDMTTRLGHDVEIEVDAVKSVYENLMRNLGPAQVRLLVEHWLAIVPGHMVRLRIMIQQTSYHNLTAFNTIGRAIIAFPDFPWGAVSAAFGKGDEITAFQSAFIAVDGNPYYGYHGNLGSAKSTNFKNLVSVAGHLLSNLQGDIHIMKAKTIKPYASVANYGPVDTIVSAYILAYQAAVRVPTAAQTGVPNAIITALATGPWPAYQGFAG